ncbi:MAG: AraC family transcriptional regulator [Opitutaceae bacterium]|jgi:AraC-like DNA-binding protein|nr:AraC family transcriptional regulator [Opitutaceae bacterium]
MPRRAAPLPQPAEAIAPAVCRAGEFQFAGGQTHVNGCVQSRGLFWCKSGRGTVRINGQDYSLEPHDLYVLPWNRRIEYFASAREPMFTAHVHLVPWIRPGSVWTPNVPHERNEPDFDTPDRRDLPIAGITGVSRYRIETEGALARLINYTTTWFRDSDRSEAEGRALGVMIWGELHRRMASTAPNIERRPEELNRLLLYIEHNYQNSPTVEQLADIIGRSRSHVLKLFQTYLHVSAKSHVLNRQLREARDLLLSTTMPIGEVGRLSGFHDPYHFSKLFRRMVGMSPKEFRAQDGPLPLQRGPSTHRKNPSSSAR